MSEYVEVTLRSAGYTVRAKVKKESLSWANTAERLDIMDNLKDRNIGFERNMTTATLKRLLDRNRDKVYEKLEKNVYVDSPKTGSIKKCLNCLGEFRIKYARQIYCSNECRLISQKQYGRLGRQDYQQEEDMLEIEGMLENE